MACVALHLKGVCFTLGASCFRELASSGGDREISVIDLQRDPNTLTLETYCSNSEVLNALVALTELNHWRTPL